MDYNNFAAAYGITKAYLETLPDSREKSLALTRLEESMMWCISAIQKHDNEQEK